MTKARRSKVLRVIDALEDHDDVQNVYANFDIPDAVLRQSRASSAGAHRVPFRKGEATEGRESWRGLRQNKGVAPRVAGVILSGMLAVAGLVGARPTAAAPLPGFGATARFVLPGSGVVTMSVAQPLGTKGSVTIVIESVRRECRGSAPLGANAFSHDLLLTKATVHVPRVSLRSGSLCDDLGYPTFDGAVVTWAGTGALGVCGVGLCRAATRKAADLPPESLRDALARARVIASHPCGIG